jgi:hypothetical protein
MTTKLDEAIAIMREIVPIQDDTEVVVKEHLARNIVCAAAEVAQALLAGEAPVCPYSESVFPNRDLGAIIPHEQMDGVCGMLYREGWQVAVNQIRKMLEEAMVKAIEPAIQFLNEYGPAALVWEVMSALGREHEVDPKIAEELDDA